MSITLKSILKELRNKWFLIVAVTFTGGLAAAFYNYYNPLLYTSTVSFLVDEDAVRKNDQNLSDQNIYLSESWPNGYRLYQMAKSTEMIDHLIKEFDLYKQYGIDEKAPLHYEIVNEMLRNYMGVTPVASGAISITFRGTDKILVAKITNAVFYKLEDMIKQYTVENMKRKLKIYNELLDNSKKEISTKTEDLKKVVDEFKGIINKSGANKNNEILFEMNLKLTELSSQIANSNSDLFKTIKNHEASLVVTNQENLPNIKLISKALQDTRPSLFWGSIKRILWCMFFVFDITVFFVILGQQNKEQEKLTSALYHKTVKFKMEN